MAYNQSVDDFSSLNDISIPNNIIDQFGGSTDRIDLEDVHDDADTQTTIASSTKRKATKQKAKRWQYFELVPTGKLVNEVPYFKVQCKHCQKKFAWQKGICTTHLNRHFKKCQYKHRGLDTNQAQLQFGSPGSEVQYSHSQQLDIFTRTHATRRTAGIDSKCRVSYYA
ncbi:zinc finger protein [Abeliophyllum distichum]|uniref:Zinc finger protein n=1 Tax=Abeliophyllum distichum TaxID=126358 RepID=A0ABD1PGE1_9LAMI